MLLLLLLTVTHVRSEDPLRAVLRSPRASLNLYSSFKEENHLLYTGAENSQRYRLFLSSARRVADYNEDETDTGHYALNKFSVMSEAEKRAYHGLNITQSEDEGEGEGEGEEDLERREVYPDQKVWTNSGAVAEVRDQKSCGSCWAFCAVGAIETRYKILSGVLRRFSEQEFLDCAYEHEKDYNGCKGGRVTRTFKWSRGNGGRLAAGKDRPYENKDKKCRASSTPDGMVAFKIRGYRYVGRGEDKHIIALQSGAVSSSVITTNKFHSYDGRIMRDTTCKPDESVNHGVTMVGYTPEYILIKNSWGRDWGLGGFAKLARYHDNCKLFTFSYYPSFTSTGLEDSGSDPAARYSDSSIADVCEDARKGDFCAAFAEQGCCKSLCPMYPDRWLTSIRMSVAEYRCEKSCNLCKCPGGTVRCDDGVCRHQHMCHHV